jgi:hypothetical protein
MTAFLSHYARRSLPGLAAALVFSLAFAVGMRVVAGPFSQIFGLSGRSAASFERPSAAWELDRLDRLIGGFASLEFGAFLLYADDVLIELPAVQRNSMIYGKDDSRLEPLCLHGWLL